MRIPWTARRSNRSNPKGNQPRIFTGRTDAETEAAILWPPNAKSQSESEVVQLCPTLCDPVDCSLSGFSIHGILQARILEWVTISFSRGSSDPGIEPGSPALEADALTSEPPGQPIEKDPGAGKDRGQEERGQQRMRWSDGITDSSGHV